MQHDCALLIAGRGCLTSLSVEYKTGGVETSGSERCHLPEDQTQDALDRPVVEKTATSSHFQQDNARSHKARVSQDCLPTVTTLPSPARSPDLSPIEHIWDHLELRVGHPTSLDELQERLQQIWNEMSQDIIQNLYASMSDRIASCIRARSCIMNVSRRQLRETSSFLVTRHGAGQRRSVRSPNLEESILIVVAVRPESSTRAVAHH
ncbi:transposable element Tcb1 transposase [Trichonephila clavipes]|nr:transposable element Tcb1 transposase [Trichonephila clavipes]